MSDDRSGKSGPPHPPDVPASGLDATWVPTPSSTRGAEPVAPKGVDYPALLPVNSEHYLLDRELARGGMGRIRLARDRRLGRAVAVKESLSKTGGAAQRLEREARITARLQHPSIVNVLEAGVWPAGEPFYAMALVKGASLESVVAKAKTLEERLTLLPNVLAVADAIAYAHGEGVIHRDLKPTNVLVGAFGETVVIDWGLAKHLTEPSDEPWLDAHAALSEESSHTAPGVVLGTPAYMPPEQALGRPVDARADVYALGALLDHVLAGKPAYTGESAAEVLEAVKRGPPVPLARRQAGLPPELLAIVERSMARDPAVRYPSGREVAEDLRRYQAGQLVGTHRYSPGQLLGRWLRRYRAAVTVAAAAAAVLLGFGVLAVQRIVTAQHLAEEQRARAERSRGDAEDLLGFMLVDLRDKLTPVGRLDLLDGVAQKAIAYYQRSDDQPDDAELRRRALARRNLGDVLSAQGHTASALQEYRAALAIGETLAAKDPSSAEWRQEVAHSRERVGDVLSSQGDTVGALAEYRAELASAEALAAKDPANAEQQRDVSLGHDRVGTALLAQGEEEQALAEFRSELAIDERLASQDPASSKRLADLAVSHMNVGNVLLARGDAAGALAEYRAELAIDEKLAERDPGNADRQVDLSDGHLKVGDALVVPGDSLGALAEYRVSLAIYEKLAAADPTNAAWQRELSVCRLKVGGVLLKQGALSQALAAYRDGVATRAALAAKDPTNADRQRDLSFGHSGVGDALRALGDLTGALAEYQAGLAIDEALAAKDPTNLDRGADLASDRKSIGDVLLERGDRAAALASFEAGLAIAQRLRSAAPRNATWRTLATDLADRTASLTAAGMKRPP